MQAKEYLANSSPVTGSKGYIDVLKNELKLYVHDTGAVSTINSILTTITTERNFVHTLLSDGITETAPTITAAATDNPGMAMYIVREVMQCIECNVPYGVGLTVDESTPKRVVPPMAQPQLMGDYVDGTRLIVTTPADRATMLLNRQDTMSALTQLFETLSAL